MRIPIARAGRAIALAIGIAMSVTSSSFAQDCIDCFTDNSSCSRAGGHLDYPSSFGEWDNTYNVEIGMCHLYVGTYCPGSHSPCVWIADAQSLVDRAFAAASNNDLETLEEVLTDRRASLDMRSQALAVHGGCEEDSVSTMLAYLPLSTQQMAHLLRAAPTLALRSKE